MTVAVMQPYIFPYLGYYQLVNAVDYFVFFDDVNYINKGWINRNNILQNNLPLRFTLPLIKASQNKLINEIELSEYEKWKSGFLKTIEMSYKKAPFFNSINTWLIDFFSSSYTKVSEITSASILAVATLLQMKTKFCYSSLLKYKSLDDQDGQMKVIEICRLLNADQYINPKNGSELYDKNTFALNDVQLHFINMDNVVYPQFKADAFVPYLSIIDVLMFNGIDGTKDLLNKYSLI